MKKIALMTLMALLSLGAFAQDTSTKLYTGLWSGQFASFSGRYNSLIEVDAGQAGLIVTDTELPIDRDGKAIGAAGSRLFVAGVVGGVLTVDMGDEHHLAGAIDQSGHLILMRSPLGTAETLEKVTAKPDWAN